LRPTTIPPAIPAPTLIAEIPSFVAVSRARERDRALGAPLVVVVRALGVADLDVLAVLLRALDDALRLVLAPLRFVAAPLRCVPAPLRLAPVPLLVPLLDAREVAREPPELFARVDFLRAEDAPGSEPFPLDDDRWPDVRRPVFRWLSAAISPPPDRL
jgi:hypothetical protein